MKEKSYIASIVSFSDKRCYVLFEITSSSYHTVLVASSFEELMILIDLNGYDLNEIKFNGGLKDYV